MNGNQETIVQPQDTTLPTICHVLGLALYAGIPFGNVWGPLILWLWKRDGNPALDEHGKEVLNFQISMSIYLVVAGLSIIVLVGFVLLPVVALVHVILTIIGTIEANKGRMYRYPMTIRFIT